jgi:hypothetical protein
MAISEAQKLFSNNTQGGQTSDGKGQQDVMNQAAGMVRPILLLTQPYRSPVQLDKSSGLILPFSLSSSLSRLRFACDFRICRSSRCSSNPR